jgi:eukaryotic-like serine/threonine-protein kinase
VLEERYELLRRLGAGGTAVVWAALDRQTKTEVAVKLLHPELVLQNKNRVRFEREALVLEKLDHPHIAKLLAHRLHHETPYFVLELLSGARLADKIGSHAVSNDPIQFELMMRIFEEICSAVAYAHERGVLHRDLKPGNVIVEPTKVLDFGLAKLADGPRDQATTRGRQIGSYFYMAPEQTIGQDSSVASDVFGLGCILYEMLTLRRAWAKDASGQPLIAFAGERAANSYNAPAEIMNRIRREARPRPSDIWPDLEPFDATIARALAVDRRDRFGSVVELLDDVRACAGLEDVTVPIDSQRAATRVDRPDSGATTLLEDTPVASDPDLISAGPTVSAPMPFEPDEPLIPAEQGLVRTLIEPERRVPKWVWAAALALALLSALATIAARDLGSMREAVRVLSGQP